MDKATGRCRTAWLIFRLDRMVAWCGAVLKDAGRWLRRWPAAILDRSAAPRLPEPQAGTRKWQPGRTRKLARNEKSEDITLERD
jgi:hypothetical protein